MNETMKTRKQIYHPIWHRFEYI